MFDQAARAVKSLFSKKEDGIERRRHTRYNCKHDTILHCARLGKGGSSIPGTIRNISVSGALFSPKDSGAAPSDDFYEFALMLDGVSHSIRIIRTTFNGYHCAFEKELDDEQFHDFLVNYAIRN